MTETSDWFKDLEDQLSLDGFDDFTPKVELKSESIEDDIASESFTVQAKH